MSKTAVVTNSSSELSEERIREQLERVVQDHVFRSSKRSVDFLRYVVEQTLKGSANRIKERTIGVDVFGKEPSYDTNSDHVVRTAAIELRKRLAIYYGEEKHCSELRLSLVPGSYIPQFTLPVPPTHSGGEKQLRPQPAHDISLRSKGSNTEFRPARAPEKTTAIPLRVLQRARNYFVSISIALFFIAGSFAYLWLHKPTAQDLFWKPVLETPGPVLLAVGNVPDGPPTLPASQNLDSSIPILHKASSPTVPFADTVTIARVVGALEAHGKKVLIRTENSSSFSDLREGAVVLIGAFNDEWSMRLTHQLRYTLALDAGNHLIYIKDAKNPSARTWSWATNQPPERMQGAAAPVLEDYALISRIWNSDTGHVVIVIGGLYSYGTQAAGEFLTDPQLMQALAKSMPHGDAHRNLQIVLGTTVTDDTPGLPKVLAVSVE